MPIIEEANLPIKPFSAAGKGVSEIASRKEINHRDQLEISELVGNFEKVKISLFGNLKALLSS